MNDHPASTSRFTVIYNSVSNICCSITIVLLNKWIYTRINFPNLTLTFLHFLTTFLGLLVCERYKMFKVKYSPFRHLRPLIFSFCGFVIFTNLSLQYNTVGTCQLAKVLTTPTIVILEEIYFRRRVSLFMKLALIVMAAGVCLTISNDVKFQPLGATFAALGVIVTSIYQILVGVKQSQLRMSPMQLLYYQSSLSSMILFVAIIFIEPPWYTMSLSLSLSDYGMIGLSCATAFFLNLSLYWIISKTSALTYNMLGHLKFCLAVMGGFILFGEVMTAVQCFGVLVTLFGITLYSQLQMSESVPERPTTPIEDEYSDSDDDDEDIVF